MIQITFKLAFLAAATLAAPAAEAEADAQFLLGGHHGLGYGHLGYAAHVVLPVCTTTLKTIVVGRHCTPVAPTCTTTDEVVGQAVTGREAPVCEDVETVVPVAHGYYGKREAEADAQVLLGHHGLGYLGHAAVTKVTTKHCVPGAAIVKDITHPITKCVANAPACKDVETQVPETVCGAPAAEAAVEAEAAVAEA